MRTCAAAVVLSLLLLVVAGSAASSVVAPGTAPAPLPRVTLISDSVAGSIAFDTGAKAILAQGVDLFLDPGEARRLGGVTPPGGIAPPTALQLIATLGRQLGPTVIMSIGYNDDSSQYAQNMATALAALQADGVKHVLWTTLHVSPDHLGYETANAAIEAAAAQDPAVTVIDWNTYAGTHPEWFQADEVHLTGAGPRALATLFHATLVKLGIPVQASLSRGS